MYANVYIHTYVVVYVRVFLYACVDCLWFFCYVDIETSKLPQMRLCVCVCIKLKFSLLYIVKNLNLNEWICRTSNCQHSSTADKIGDTSPSPSACQPSSACKIMMLWQLLHSIIIDTTSPKVCNIYYVLVYRMEKVTSTINFCLSYICEETQIC